MRAEISISLEGLSELELTIQVLVRGSAAVDLGVAPEESGRAAVPGPAVDLGGAPEESGRAAVPGAAVDLGVAPEESGRAAVPGAAVDLGAEPAEAGVIVPGSAIKDRVPARVYAQFKRGLYKPEAMKRVLSAPALTRHRKRFS